MRSGCARRPCPPRAEVRLRYDSSDKYAIPLRVTRFAIRTLELGPLNAVLTAVFLGTLPPLVVWSKLSDPVAIGRRKFPFTMLKLMAMVISSAGIPPFELGKRTRRLSLHMPLRMGKRPVNNAARDGEQTLQGT